MQSPEPFALPDSSYVMTFRALDDRRLLLIHSQNRPGHERARLRKLRAVPGGVELVR